MTPRTEAGKRLLATLKSFLAMEEGHPQWLAVGGPQQIAATEAEAVALRDAELAAKVQAEILPLIVGTKAEVHAGLAILRAVLRLIEEVASPNREPGAL